MRPKTVLIVDDDEDIRLICELAIRRVGEWKAVLAASGVEALEKASSDQPDVILLDVMMPEVDGLAVLATLQRQPETRAIPVIFLTARVQAAELEHYMAMGASGVIPKPFDVMMLTEQVRSILGPN